MARQAVLHRDVVCTRRRSDSGVADAQKDPPNSDHGSASQAASQCCVHAQSFRHEAARKRRNNCRRLDARAGVCCAMSMRQSNRKNPLRGKAAAYSRRGMRLCSRIALTGFPRGVADTQKDPPKPDHGSAGRAASRWCLYAQAFGLEAARKMRNNCRRLDTRRRLLCK